jgi:hypothetical protein
MTRLGTRSELDKLAVTLALSTDELSFLNDVAPQELRKLRVAIYERLFEQDRVLFERLAAIAARMPAAVAAHIAQALGPMIAARVAVEVPPGSALEIVRRVPISFFADACAYLDPRRSRELIVRIPAQTVVEVAQELVRREEFATISRFVDFVTDEQTAAVLDGIEDEAAILRVAFYMGSKNRIDHLLQTLPRERLERLIIRVEQEGELLLPEFLSVLIHVSYAIKRRLSDLMADQHPSVLDGYVRSTQALGLWGDVLPVVAGMSESAQHRVVNLPILSEREVQDSIVATADGDGLWGLLLPMVKLMDDRNRDAVAAIIAARDGSALERASDAALMGEHWTTLFDLATRMPEHKRVELAGIIGRLLRDSDRELLDRLAREAPWISAAADRASA